MPSRWNLAASHVRGLAKLPFAGLPALVCACGAPCGSAGAGCMQTCPAGACRNIVECSAEVPVEDDSTLTDALAIAKPGTCIVLSGGTYGDVTLPPGVKLLADCGEEVHTGTVVVSPGEGAEMCGLTVGGKGLSLNGATGVRVRNARVTSSEDGIRLAAGSTMALEGSEITASHRYGIYGAGDVSVAITGTQITGSGADGVLLECGPGENCCAAGAARPQLAISDTSIVSNHLSGLRLSGADANLDTVSVTATLAGEEWQFGQYGLGVAASLCSAIQGRGLTVTGNAAQGVLLDASGALLGGPGPSDGVTIRDNTLGVTIVGAKETSPVAIEGAIIADNKALGLLIFAGSMHVTVTRTQITGTRKAAIAKEGGGVVEVGDGLLWMGESNAILQDVVLNDNDRAGLLIDGPVGTGAQPSALHSVQASGNGAAQLLQQRLPPGGAVPDLDGTELTVTPMKTLDVPQVP